MKNTRSDFSRGSYSGDLAAWLREHAEDNEEQLARLRKNLRLARERELTPCQQHVLELHYEQGLSVTQIAKELGVNPSTVSRTLRRAHDRLRRCLRYAL